MQPIQGLKALLFGVLMLFQASTASAQIEKLVHQDSTAGNFFGVAVSISGDLALVGASGENTCGLNSGAAYVYQRDAGTGQWVQTARLVADDCSAESFFGRSVTLSGDRAVVASVRSFFGTSKSNAAYVFERDPLTGTWKHVERITGNPNAKEGAFATSVSLDGDRLLIVTSGDPTGGQYHGVAHVYERDPQTNRFVHRAELMSSGGLRAGIFGGHGVLKGDYIAVTASTYYQDKPGTIYLFERNADTGKWVEVQRLTGINDFFMPIDLGDNQIIVGQSRAGERKQSGEATIYTRGASGKWIRTATLRPRVPYEYGAFGATVSLEGDRALVTGFDEQLGFDTNIDRVVYYFVYDRDHGAWYQSRVFDVGDVAFGSALDHDGRTAVIGQAQEGSHGAAYLVRLP